MRVAVAADGHRVAQHFGHCKDYILFTVVDREIKEREVVKNPGHRPDFLPHFLSQQGVDTMIAGGMGHRALQLFEEHGIETYIGVEGLVDRVIDHHLKGELKTGDNTCHH